MGSPLETLKSLDPEMDQIRRNLFKSAMRGEWQNVVETYRGNHKAYTARVTKSRDTALHLAVRDGQEGIVDELVSIISNSNRRDEAKEALQMANDQGNTALHIAAAVGNVRICYCIAKEDVSMVGARNADGETPFFLAAFYGKRDAFLCLHNICGASEGPNYYRRGIDGDTILHVAIAGEYFDLAFQITNLYEELANSVNASGVTPLQLLATKPNVFRSGTHLAGYHKLIYNCMFADELEVVDMSNEQLVVMQSNNIKKSVHPQNYETCMNFFWLPGKAFALARNWYRSSENLRGDIENQQGTRSKRGASRRPRLIPSNYYTCLDILKFASKAMLVILGLGSQEIKKLQEKKKKHTWSVQILDELIQRLVMYESPQPMISTEGEPYAFGAGGEVRQTFMETRETTQQTHIDNRDIKPQENIGIHGAGDHNKMMKKETPVFYPEREDVTQMVEKIVEYYPLGDKKLDYHNVVLMATEKPKTTERPVKESAVLLAAKNGITEMVERILEKFPVAIYDVNPEKKNIVLLAVENRQPHVYKLLLKTKVMKDSIFRAVDNQGNSALHLAAKLGNYKPWRIPGAALQMQWEIRWFDYVKDSMPSHFFPRYNKNNETAKDLFTETHKELVRSGGEWLMNTSESCSVVAALIATVAFATSAAVPGGVNEKSGTPTLEKHPAFNAFAISSLVALCFSVTSVVMFLAILTSRYQEKDFGKILPRRVLIGLTSLFVSIAAILVSFCAGHFFVLRDELKLAAFPVYAVTCLPVTFFAVAQFPLYFDLIWATFKKVPQRSYMVVQ